MKRAIKKTILFSTFVGVTVNFCYATFAGEVSPAARDAAAHQRADWLLSQLTLDEKLQFIESAYPDDKVPGGGAGYIKGVPRLGIPDLDISDSGNGSGSGTQKSTTFPAPIATAASWDAKLSYQYGAEIARQLRAQGFSMGLGGGANLAREPRAGRLFEMLGEDPVLAGKLLASRTNGTQSQKVIASVKHFIGNEQETNRMQSNSQIDERTLRELYLLPFEIAVREGDPGSVMSSYNKLNGTFTAENKHLLTNILKEEWGFQGQVESDWGGNHSTVASINAGLDEAEDDHEVSIPWFNPVRVKAALASHAIAQDRLDDMVRRKLYVMIKTGVMDDPPKGGAAIDFEAARKFSQHAEEQSIVLLKNTDHQLPLDHRHIGSIAVIGGHADAAVLTGGGSADPFDPVSGSFSDCSGLSFVKHDGCGWWPNPWLKLDVPILNAIQGQAPAAKVTFAGNGDATAPFRPYTKAEIDRAVELAHHSDVAVVFVTQSAGEDFGDLGSLKLANPDNQNELVAAVAAANPHTVVVVEAGNPVLMPWKDKVSAIVDAWYPGEGGGVAIANMLFGNVNPSGKLPFTFPARDEDTPTWGAAGNLEGDPVYVLQNDPKYSENLDIGYRWYDAKDIKPMFEFGYGLSYTHFAYSNVNVRRGADHVMTVSFDVKNDGSVAGAEVPQVYLKVPDPEEPPQRLVGWEKVSLNPGETKHISIDVSGRMQSVWDEASHQWKFIPASEVHVGASSRDIRLTAE
jgi:beta-glucosidase